MCTTCPAEDDWTSNAPLVATLSVASAPGGSFGWGIALSADGTTALIGNGLFGSVTDSCELTVVGNAYIFHVASESDWVSSSTPTATLSDGGAAGDCFGAADALSADGTTALIGAYAANSAYGAAYIYHVSAETGWSSTSTPTATLSDPQAGWFSWSLALSADGTTALIGAPDSSAGVIGSGAPFTGIADLFHVAGEADWATTSTPTATLSNPADEYYSVFGWSVALSQDGTTALIGGDGAGVAGADAGAVYVFNTSSESAWTSDQTPSTTLTFALGYEGFGWSIALSADGTTALIGEEGALVYGNVAPTNSTPDGSGTMTVSPSAVVANTAANSLTFTYTATGGRLDDGTLEFQVPAGWSITEPSETTCGFVKSDGFSYTQMTDVEITGVTLAAGASCTITYGIVNDAHAPSSATTSTFTTSEASTLTGTLKNIAVSPVVTVKSSAQTLAMAATTYTTVSQSGAYNVDATTNDTDPGATISYNVSVTDLDSAGCSVNATGGVTFTGAGVCTINAVGNASANFIASAVVKQLINVYVVLPTDTITFDSDGGTPVSPISGPRGSTITLPPAPTLLGSNFDGWSTQNPDEGYYTILKSPYTLTGSVTLYAEWTLINYDITFDSEGGSSVGGYGANYGDTFILPAAPTFAGFTFDGWFSAPSGGTALTSPYTITGNATLYAQWTPNSGYSLIMFNSEGGSAVDSVGGPNSSAITLPTAPTYTGHTFDGWFVNPSSGTALKSPYTLTGSTTLYAQWTANVVTDTYSYNTAGGSTAPAGGSGSNGSSITLAGAPTKSDFTFAGWNDGTTTYGAGTSYTLNSNGAAILFTAQWTANVVTDTYSYNTAGGSTAPAGGSGSNGSSITLAGAPTKSDFTFAGWNDGTTTYGAGTSYTLNSNGAAILFTAQWTANVVTDTYSYNTAGGSTAPAGGSGSNGSSITLAGAPTKSDFTFAGWNDGTTTYGAGTSYTLNSNGAAILFTAQWTANVVTDTYSYNTAGGSTAPAGGSGSNGSSITLAGAPTKSDFTFAGWNDGTTTYGAGTSYTLNSNGAAILFTAQWTANVVTDTYSYNTAGGSTAPAGGSGSNGSSITLAGAPTKSDFTFAGWNDGTTTYGAGTSYTLNSNGAAILFTAQWTANVVTDTYSYNTAGGSTAPAGGSGSNGSSITLAGAPTKSDFTFAGWNDGTTTYGAGTSYTLNSNGAAILFTAQWTANVVTDTYSYNTAGGSTAPAGGSGSNGSSITLAGAPTKSDFTFAGWNDGTTTYGAGTSYTLNSNGAAILFTAQWTANVVTDTYSYNTAGGSTAPAGGSGSNGSSITLAGAPTKSDFTFAGWNDGTTTYGAGTSYTLNSNGAAILFTAQWTANVVTDTYSYNTAGGSTAPAGGSGSNGSSITLAGAPTKSDFTFAGWNDGTTTYGAGTSYTLNSNGAAILFTAQWTANVPMPLTTFSALTIWPAVASYGHERGESFVVTVSGMKSARPTGTVTIKFGSTILCSTSNLTPLFNGTVIASCSLSNFQLPIGNYSLTATYSGDSHYASSTSLTKELRIVKDWTFVSVTSSPWSVNYGNESTATFRATVWTGAGESVPNGETVTVRVGSATCTAVLRGGTGTCSIANSALPPGQYAVGATYGGDATLSGSSSIWWNWLVVRKVTSHATSRRLSIVDASYGVAYRSMD